MNPIKTLNLPLEANHVQMFDRWIHRYTDPNLIHSWFRPDPNLVPNKFTITPGTSKPKHVSKLVPASWIYIGCWICTRNTTRSRTGNRKPIRRFSRNTSQTIQLQKMWERKRVGFGKREGPDSTMTTGWRGDIRRVMGRHFWGFTNRKYAKRWTLLATHYGAVS